MWIHLVIIVLVIMVLILCCVWVSFHSVRPSLECLSKLDLRRYKEGKRVVCSLTTSPQRLSYVEDVLQCLLQQVVLPDRIYLNIPHTYTRTGESYDTMKLMHLQNLSSRIHILRSEDYGPITKVIPTALRETDPETVIISVDDDIYYPPTMIGTLLAYDSAFQGGCAISNRTFSTYLQSIFEMTVPLDGCNLPYLKAWFVEGFSGVLYRRKHLHVDELLRDSRLCKECFRGDDFVISNMLARNDIPVRSLLHHCQCLFGDSHLAELKPLEYGLITRSFGLDDPNALHKLDNNKNYRLCQKQLQLHHLAAPHFPVLT